MKEKVILFGGVLDEPCVHYVFDGVDTVTMPIADFPYFKKAVFNRRTGTNLFYCREITKTYNTATVNVLWRNS